MSTLRDLRERKGWVLAQLSRNLGLSEASVSRIERGARPKDPLLLKRWLGLLEADADDVLKVVSDVYGEAVIDLIRGD